MLIDCSREVVLFLGQLLHMIRGFLLVISDGIRRHSLQDRQSLLAAGSSSAVHLERCPGYAPDLNPYNEVPTI